MAALLNVKPVPAGEAEVRKQEVVDFNIAD